MTGATGRRSSSTSVRGAASGSTPELSEAPLAVVERIMAAAVRAFADADLLARVDVAPLIRHLDVLRPLVADVTVRDGLATAAAAHRRSCVRLERMLHLLERVERMQGRTASFDGATIRASLALQLQEHALLENALLAQLAEQLTAEDMRALALAYESAWSGEAALASQPGPARR
jgi:hypothetical protein